MSHLGSVGGLVTGLILGATSASGACINFDGMKLDVEPSGWTCGSTGGGKPKWAVAVDATAPSPGRVLKQSGDGTYPWCAKSGAALADGHAEVRFKPQAGSEDQAGGLVFRFEDGDNYYVARANALENNVRLYHTEKGDRRMIKGADAKVAANAWHTLRVEFRGERLTVQLDGKTMIEATDGTFKGSGRVGVWTKADSVTAFDDFCYGEK